MGSVGANWVWPTHIRMSPPQIGVVCILEAGRGIVYSPMQSKK
jgi:hypothetical protein